MYKRKDHYYKKAKQEGYRSRAAYKLLEIQKKHRLFRRGDRVLDLGCAPGGWLQVIAAEVGPRGKVLGVDRLPVKPLPFKWVTVERGDIRDAAFCEHFRSVIPGKVRVVTSDMAPDTTGVAFQDHVRSCELVLTAFGFAREALSPEGSFLAKLFQGEDAAGVMSELRTAFRKARWVVPVSSRKKSAEIYLLATGYIGP